MSTLESTSPVAALRAVFRVALAASLGPDFAEEDPQLRPSAHADFQANLAMALGRRVGRPPRAIAEELAKALPTDGVLARVELAGPGFLNLTLSDAWLTSAANAMRADARLGVPVASPPERVVVDYSSPNVAKEMHVGHLRSTVLGDALARTLGFLGHEILRQNHLGDWGTPFGMLIEHLLELGEQKAQEELGVGELSSFYKAARARFDADPAFAERARQRVVSLQGGDAETLRLWSLLVEHSKRYFAAVYEKLDVTLQPGDIRGESSYNDLLAPLCEELEKSGQARVDNGALCVFPPGFVNKEKEPLPLLLRKTDGGFGYATTDLAALRHRFQTLGATRVLYVVGHPQELHFSMLFAAGKMLGWYDAPKRAEHVSFGSVLGTDKRMYRTRQGETVRLVDLIDAAIERAEEVARQNIPDMDPALSAQIGREVGIGAVKYADLSSDRVKDYVFDLDRMVQFTGKTAGYLQYAHARINSIFGKVRKPLATDAITLRTAEFGTWERTLVLRLLGFSGVLAQVEQTLQPHHLCTWLYDLADAFSGFFDNCRVKGSEPEVEAARLALCELTARALSTGLGLLGIRAPERM